jgi:hypothetical protein
MRFKPIYPKTVDTLNTVKKHKSWCNTETWAHTPSTFALFQMDFTSEWQRAETRVLPGRGRRGPAHTNWTSAAEAPRWTSPPWGQGQGLPVTANGLWSLPLSALLGATQTGQAPPCIGKCQATPVEETMHQIEDIKLKANF